MTHVWFGWKHEEEELYLHKTNAKTNHRMIGANAYSHLQNLFQMNWIWKKNKRKLQRTKQTRWKEQHLLSVDFLKLSWYFMQIVSKINYFFASVGAKLSPNWLYWWRTIWITAKRFVIIAFITYCVTGLHALPRINWIYKPHHNSWITTIFLLMLKTYLKSLWNLLIALN